MQALPASVLSGPAIASRFASHATPWTPESVRDNRIDATRRVRAAAVLIPILTHLPEPEVLLTVRPDHLRAHAGQIAFPGGAVEADDADRVATALREAQEEVGLDLAAEQVLGSLPTYETGTGFDVTPVVALLADEPQLTPDPNEVAHTFQVPLAFLMDPRNHRRHRWGEGAASRTFYSMPWQREPDGTEFFIWGVTAAILRNLYHFLRADSDRH